MCDYKILAHNSNGYVILCNSCQHYQLAFGTSVIVFEPDQFFAFYKEAQELKDQLICDGFEKHKCMSLSLPCHCTSMVLSYLEFEKLNELISESLFSQQLELLMEELKISH